MKPIISVIIPVYNSEKYIQTCIDSILAQTFKEFELILIDDGSTDNGGFICDEFAQKDDRIKVVHKKNEGVSEARNTGIALAKGDYLTFVDSDDCIDTEFLYYALSETQKHNVDMFISGITMEFFDVDNVSALRYTIDKSQRMTVRELFEKLDKSYPQICICGPWCKLYKRNVVINSNVRFDRNLNNGEDTLFNLDYLKHINTLFFASDIFYHYRRVNSDSLFSRFRKDSYEILDFVYGKMYSLMLAEKCSEESLDTFKKMYFSMLLGGISKFFAPENKIGEAQLKMQIQKVCNDPFVKKYKFGSAKGIKANTALWLMNHKRYGTVYAMFKINSCIKRKKII
jgi:glycosyltransferase involved in cell wall biosynthesis